MAGEQPPPGEGQIDPLTGLPVEQPPNFFPFGKDSILTYKKAA